MQDDNMVLLTTHGHCDVHGIPELWEGGCQDLRPLYYDRTEVMTEVDDEAGHHIHRTLYIGTEGK